MKKSNYSPNLNPSLSEGTIVFLDLDKFGECMDFMGWTRYTPNEITGFMTEKIMLWISTYFAVHIWGMNEKEGTEEAMLAFFQDPEEIYDLMESFRNEIFLLAQKIKAPTTLSIGISTGLINMDEIKPISHHRQSDISKDPTRRLAFKAIQKAKKMGGNQTFRL
jgi:hypothetical protein